MTLFFVSPAFRGRSIGTRMLEFFANEMARMGYERCYVTTSAGNVASQVAQQKAGFQLAQACRDQLLFARDLRSPTS